MGAINVELYTTIDGRCPVANFLATLDYRMHAKVLHTIDLLEANGTELRMPFSVSLGDVHND